MNHGSDGQTYEKVGQAMPRIFEMHVTRCLNGYILNVNHMTFVIQGTGDEQENLEELIKAIRTAHKNAGPR